MSSSVFLRVHSDNFDDPGDFIFFEAFGEREADELLDLLRTRFPEAPGPYRRFAKYSGAELTPAKVQVARTRLDYLAKQAKSWAQKARIRALGGEVPGESAKDVDFWTFCSVYGRHVNSGASSPFNSAHPTPQAACASTSNEPAVLNDAAKTERDAFRAGVTKIMELLEALPAKRKEAFKVIARGKGESVAASLERHVETLVEGLNAAYVSARRLKLPTDPGPLLKAFYRDGDNGDAANREAALDTLLRLLLDVTAFDSWSNETKTKQSVRRAMQAAPGPVTPVVEAMAIAEKYVFRREGNLWEIRFEGGKVERFEDAKGLQHIHRLLQSLGKAVSALELMGVDASKFVVSRDAGGDRFNDEALTKAKEAIGDIEKQIDDTINPERKTELKEQIQRIERELKTRGPRKKRKLQKTQHDKAADAVQKNITKAYEVIQRMSALVQHLQQHIRTGRDCIYETSNVSWTLQ